MADDMPMVERIQANAELVVSVAAQQLGETSRWLSMLH
jgi:hypothetical protein